MRELATREILSNILFSELIGTESMDPVNPDHVLAAFSRIGGTSFENFANEFFAGYVGPSFVPAGGMHDGGIDAFKEESLLVTAKTGTFYQSSIAEDFKSKIRRSVKRIREVGREIRSLYYLTNHIIPYLDQVEEDLSAELNVNIRIRDGKYIANNINANDHTRSAFYNHLEPLLLKASFGQTSRNSIQATDVNLEACVFLSYEVDQIRTSEPLFNAVLDGLIIWALEETDPEQNVFLTEDDIKKKIQEGFQFAKSYLGSVRDRLNALTAKDEKGNRSVRSHKGGTEFCLPFESRKKIKSDHALFDSLVFQVREQSIAIAKEYIPEGSNAVDPNTVADIVGVATEKAFYREGLKIGVLVSGKDDVPELEFISDYVDEAILSSALTGEAALETRAIALKVLRRAFYESTPEQRQYFHLLFRTYSLLLTLRYEPRVVEFFQSMQRSFRLYVGSDIIVRALSEFMLRPEDRMTENLLGILTKAGSELILTDFVLNEIWTHLGAADREFVNHYAPVEPHINLELASQIDRILVRAYFYSRLAPIPGVKSAAGWKSYIEQFCSYDDLHKLQGRDQLRTFLIKKYGMNFETAGDLDKVVDADEVKKLKDRLLSFKKHEELAVNDAKVILAVYAKRLAAGERFKGNPFGFSTWWLTHESRVQEGIEDLIKAHGSKCIIRPEFLAYYVAFSPTIADVAEVYKRNLPTIQGVRLGNRVSIDLVHEVVGKAKTYMDSDPARITAVMESFSNRLKESQRKKYNIAG